MLFSIKRSRLIYRPTPYPTWQLWRRRSSRDTRPFPVAKGVDAKEIETEGSKRDERMDPLFFQASVPNLDQPLGELRSFDCTNRPEADANRAVRVPLDDVAVSRLERPRIAEAGSGDPGQFLGRADLDLLVCVP